MVTAVIAAIEAAAAAALGLTIAVVPALVLWAVTFELAAEPSAVFAGGAAVWALGNLAPLNVTLTPELALGFGLPAEALTVVVSLAPLGLTLLTVLLAARAGWRLGARGGVGGAGVLGGALGYGAAACVVALFIAQLLVWPPALAGLVAGLVYGVPAGLGYLVRAARDEHPWWRSTVRALQRGLEQLGAPGIAALPARAADALRLTVGALAGLVGLSGVALAGALFAGYGEITALTQHLQLDPLGSLLLFGVQLALLPVALLWGLSWLTGAGFAVGSGTSVTPFETLLGPLPALPLFGAIPQGWGALGALAPALVVLVGIGIAVLLGRRAEARRASWPVALSTAAVAAVLAGLVVAGLAALATGAIGPDRLAEAGPSPWLAGGLAAAELGAGLLLGTAAARIDAARVRELIPEGLAESIPVAWGADRAGRAGDTDRADRTDRAAAEGAGWPAGERGAEFGAPDEQETRPLEPLEPLAEVTELPLPTDRDADGELPEPTELEPTALEPTEPAEPQPAAPAPIGELYDQESVPDRDSPDRDAPAAPEASEVPSDLEAPEAPDAAAEEAALAAYAWDENATGEVAPPETGRRPGWRLRGPGR